MAAHFQTILFFTVSLTERNSLLQLSWLELLDTGHIGNALLVLLYSCPLQRESAYRAVAQKRPRNRSHRKRPVSNNNYIVACMLRALPSNSRFLRSYCLAAVLYATVLTRQYFLI
jgi:hypothetical protein